MTAPEIPTSNSAFPDRRALLTDVALWGATLPAFVDGLSYLAGDLSYDKAVIKEFVRDRAPATAVRLNTISAPCPELVVVECDGSIKIQSLSRYLELRNAGKAPIPSDAVSRFSGGVVSLKNQDFDLLLTANHCIDFCRNPYFNEQVKSTDDFEFVRIAKWSNEQFAAHGISPIQFDFSRRSEEFDGCMVQIRGVGKHPLVLQGELIHMSYSPNTRFFLLFDERALRFGDLSLYSGHENFGGLSGSPVIEMSTGLTIGTVANIHALHDSYFYLPDTPRMALGICGLDEIKSKLSGFPGLEF